MAKERNNEKACGYPRPQLQRKNWQPLNGEWDFFIDHDASCENPECISWGSRIVVPFAPETKASGVHDNGYFKACWYRREFTPPPLAPSQRLLLHFGAVDHSARVWVNGQHAGSHEGGYTPFSLDITPFLKGTGPQTLIVKAFDDPQDLQKPRGKQDWQLKPHSIWYPRTTGIWQTVWTEITPATYIGNISWIPNLVRWELGFEAWLGGSIVEGCALKLTLTCKGKLLAKDEYRVLSQEVHRRIALSDPGIDDFRNEFLWSPESPILIHGHIQLCLPSGEVIDEIETYTALRTVSIESNQFILNGRPYYLRLVLDQGYWDDTGLTPRDDSAIETDIRLIKDMGFNGVRKHQKIEDPRFLYMADRMGLLVWEEMPSAYRFTQSAIERMKDEWTDVIRRDISHPCIVAWVPFNESWGVPNLPDNPLHRNYVQALYYLTKSLDETRPVVGNDGWENISTDIIGIHDYDAEPDRIMHRYRGDKLLPHILTQERPGGRLLVLDTERLPKDHAVVLSEFGGIAYAINEQETWGYSRCKSSDDLACRFKELMNAIHSLGILTGFCYTQLTDTYQEANGLLYIDRRPKFNVADIRKAVKGTSLNQHEKKDPDQT